MVLDGDLRLVSFTPLIHLLKANSVDPDQTPCTAASDLALFAKPSTRF